MLMATIIYILLHLLTFVINADCACNDPSSVDHTTRNITGHDNGDVVVFTCVDGYRMDEDPFELQRTRTCVDGTWNGASAHCIVVTCTNQGPAANATHSPTAADVEYDKDVTYTCNDGYRTPAGARTTSLTCQANGELDAPKPTCQRVACPTPETVPFSSHTQAATFYYQDEVEYDCDAGYEHTEGDSRLVCDPHKNWNGTWPLCTKKICGDPGELAHSSRILEGTKYQHTVTYTCFEGYERNTTGGPLNRTCDEHGAWSGDTPSCVGKYCGQPPSEPSNADHAPTDPSFRYPETLAYTCHSGYKPDYSDSGLSETSCQKDGTWNFDLMKCTPVHCPETNRSVNAIDDPGTFFYGDTKTYRCNVGYILESGDLARDCQANGTFSGTVPICSKIVCRTLVTPDHSNRTGDNHNYLDVVTFECDAGYQVAGEVNVFKRALICQVDQTWSSTEPTCEPLPCGRPSYGSHTIHVSGVGEGYGDTVVLACEVGYERSDGDLSRTCQDDGTWTGATPICTPMKCQDPPSKAHVVRHGNTFQYPARVYYECDSGYKKVPGEGGEFYECQADGTWGGENSGIPTCDPVPCYQPETIRGATLLNSNTATYLYGDSIVYECQYGHTHSADGGPLNRTCSHAKSWSGERPVCERNSCGDPGEEPGAYKIGFSFRYQDTVNYTCKAGYEVDSGRAWSVLTCLANGTWVGEYPVCKRVYCGDPGQSNHSSRVVHGMHYGDKIVYKCAEGYRVTSGIYQIECIEDRTWTYSTPQCVPVENINLTAPIDGTPIAARDSEEGKLIGKICVIVMAIEFGMIVILDITTIWKDLRIMIKNIKHGVRQMKKRLEHKDDRVSPLPLPDNAH